MSTLATALLVGVLVLVLSPDAAVAHPFGPPPTARVGADGRTVTIHWSATPDDAVAIGELLGLMPAGSVEAYRQESAAQVAPSLRDEAALAGSPLLAEYLTKHIVVEQDGEPCPAEVPPRPTFVQNGATVVATCSQPVREVTLRITMLHDVNPAYRTVAIGEASRPAQSVFTVAEPSAQWEFGTAATSPFFLLPAWTVTLVVALAAVSAGLWAWRRKRRS